MVTILIRKASGILKRSSLFPRLIINSCLWIYFFYGSIVFIIFISFLLNLLFLTHFIEVFHLDSNILYNNEFYQQITSYVYHTKNWIVNSNHKFSSKNKEIEQVYIYKRINDKSTISYHLSFFISFVVSSQYKNKKLYFI